MIDKANETSEKQQSVVQSARVKWTVPELMRLDSEKCGGIKAGTPEEITSTGAS